MTRAMITQQLIAGLAFGATAIIGMLAVTAMYRKALERATNIITRSIGEWQEEIRLILAEIAIRQRAHTPDEHTARDVAMKTGQIEQAVQHYFDDCLLTGRTPTPGHIAAIVAGTQAPDTPRLADPS